MRETHWTCPQCGTGHDRNENAALNLLGLALEAARDLPKSTLEIWPESGFGLAGSYTWGHQA